MNSRLLTGMFGLFAAVCVVVAPNLARPTSVVEDFNDPIDPATWLLTGDGASHDETNGRLVLTSAGGDLEGSGFLRQTIDATKFDASFRLYIGNGSGADGLTFAWVRGPTFLGGGGGSLGFYGGLDGYAVKFDTYTGGAPEPENYVAAVSGTQGAGETGFFFNDTIPEMEDAGWFYVEIKFNNGHLQMWMSNESLGYPLTLVLDGTIAGYAGFDAYFGFTAATGGATNNHWIDDFMLNKGATAPDDFRVYGGDTVTLTGSAPSGYTLATWAQIGGSPAVTLTPTGDLEVQFDAPELEIGTILTFRFTVNHPDTGTTFDDVSVTVTAINAPKLPPSNIKVLPLDLGASGLGFRTVWDALVDAEQYEIGLKSGDDIYWLETISNTTYEVKGLTDGQARTIAIRGKNKYGASADPAAIAEVPYIGMRNLARPAAQGGTSEPSGYVYAVSHYAIAGMNNIAYNDTNDSWNGVFKGEDYWGYLWGSALFLDHVAYYTGSMFGDGGWFLDLKVQYTTDAGTTWNDAPILDIYPEMSFTNAQSGKKAFTRYDLTIPTLRGNGIRIAGTPGGTATFTSISELEVFGLQTQGPIVVQGIDAEYPEGGTALLDGTLTFSAAGPITSYQWTGPGGITITNPTSAVASFTAPHVAADTVYVFSLQAGDGTNTGTDADVQILVKNLVTTAVAGPNQWVLDGSGVTLDGSASISTTGTLTYLWTQTAGTNVGVTGNANAVVPFTAPVLWGHTEKLTFRLDVNDGAGGTSTDEVVVKVNNSLTASVITMEPFDPADWRLQGSANYDDVGGVLEITPNVNSQTGSAFLTQPIDCTRFRARFKLYIGDGDGADGMVFGWLRGPSFMGGGGGALGWLGGGLRGYGIVFDEYPNPATNRVSFENPEVHTAENTGGYVSYTPPIDMENAGWFDVEVEMDNGHLQVYMTNEGAGMPRTLAIDYTLAGYTGFDAYFGFTGATGGLNNNHWVDELPLVLANAYGARDLPAGSYQTGVPVPVEVSLRVNPASTPPSVDVVEQIPPGLSAGDVNAPGATVGGGQIRWSLIGGNVKAQTFSYTVTPPEGMTEALAFSGTVSFPGQSSDILGDSAMYPVPTAPRYVEAAMFMDAVVSWSAPLTPGVSSYSVFRSVNGGDWELLATTAGTSYVDSSVVAGENYSYQVSATNGVGDEGPTSRPTPQATPLTQAEVEQGREIREAEDFNCGGEPYTPGCTANEAPTAGDLDPQYDYFHPNTGGPNAYRPNEVTPAGIGIETVLDDGTTDVWHTNIGWIDVTSWWRYTFNVTQAGWVDIALRVAAPSSGTMAVYWDEVLIGRTHSFSTGSWHRLIYVQLEDRIEATTGEHVVRVESVAGGMNF
ncbi:MAG: hypothetical protein Q8Q12_20060, partial [bacterium]|nr:hypothetical protein [bacterium]